MDSFGVVHAFGVKWRGMGFMFLKGPSYKFGFYNQFIIPLHQHKLNLLGLFDVPAYPLLKWIMDKFFYQFTKIAILKNLMPRCI